MRAAWYEKNAYPPRKAAAQIIAAVEKGKPRLLIGPESYLIDALKRLTPVIGNKVVCDLIIRVLQVEHMRERRRLQWEQTMGEPRE